MFKFCFWVFIIYCVVAGSSDDSTENELKSTQPSSNFSSPDTSGERSDNWIIEEESTEIVLSEEELELRFAIDWLEILLPLQREPLGFEESTLLFLSNPSSALARGNYIYLLNNRKNVYEKMGKLEPPESIVHIYTPFAQGCLNLSDDMESLRNLIINVFIDVESESGFYKFGQKYLEVEAKLNQVDNLVLPVMNYLESKFSNEYIMEQAPHLFDNN